MTGKFTDSLTCGRDSHGWPRQSSPKDIDIPTGVALPAVFDEIESPRHLKLCSGVLDVTQIGLCIGRGLQPLYIRATSSLCNFFVQLHTVKR